MELGGIVIGMIIGAIIGAAIAGISAAITGGDIGSSMLYGAIGGAIAGGIAGYLSPAGSAGSSAGYTPANLEVAAANQNSVINAVSGSSVSGSIAKEGALSSIASKAGSALTSDAALIIGGSVLQGYATNRASDKATKAAAEEAAKNRAFTAAENKKSREASAALAEMNLGYNYAALESSDNKWREELAEGRRQFDVVQADAVAQRKKAEEALASARASRSVGSFVESPSILEQTVNSNSTVEQDLPTLDGGEVAYG